MLEIFEYWEKKCPPMPEIVADFLGWEPRRGADGDQSPEERFEAARAMGAAILPGSAIPKFVREGYTEWLRTKTPPALPQPTAEQKRTFEQ